MASHGTAGIAALGDDPHDDVVHPSAILFVAAHLAGLAAFWTGVTLEALILGAARISSACSASRRVSPLLRASHLQDQPRLSVRARLRSCSPARRAVVGRHHRRHHHALRHRTDVHSRQHGCSHIGLDLAPMPRCTDWARIPIWRSSRSWAGSTATPIAVVARLWPLCCSAAGGLVVGLLLAHGRAVARHVHDQLALACAGPPPLRDRRRFAQQPVARRDHDGRGWHNNHHHYQGSARQGFFWWEYDSTLYASTASSWFGVVPDRKLPPTSPLPRGEQCLGRRAHPQGGPLARLRLFLTERFPAQAHEGRWW